jgi:hypothetical protein
LVGMSAPPTLIARVVWAAEFDSRNFVDGSEEACGLFGDNGAGCFEFGDGMMMRLPVRVPTRMRIAVFELKPTSLKAKVRHLRRLTPGDD